MVCIMSYECWEISCTKWRIEWLYNHYNDGILNQWKWRVVSKLQQEILFGTHSLASQKLSTSQALQTCGSQKYTYQQLLAGNE